MRKILIPLIVLLWSANAMAQEQLAFPFQGGKDAMNQFFKDSLIVSHDMIQHRAAGIVIFKFTADEQGRISKVIIYYADDAVLAEPAIDALRKSNRKWIIPNHEKTHDFIIPFAFNFKASPTEDAGLQKEAYNYNRNRRPIAATNEVPLNMATLLPAIIIKYDIIE